MRLTKWMSVPLFVMCFAVGACDSGDKVDTSALEKSFSSAQPASKTAVDDVKAAIAAKDYAKAGAALQKLASGASLTPDQKKAVEDLAGRVKEMVTQKAKDVAKEGDKAIEDVKKRLSN
jgi:hypothetical protein